VVQTSAYLIASSGIEALIRNDSGFRPSDDACFYPYLLPSNMFAVVTLRQLSEIAHTVYMESSLQAEALELAKQIDDGDFHWF